MEEEMEEVYTKAEEAEVEVDIPDETANMEIIPNISDCVVL